MMLPWRWPQPAAARHRSSNRALLVIHFSLDGAARSAISRPRASASSASVEHVAHPRGELGISERLGDQFDARIEPAVMDDRVARIAGGEQYAQLRPQRPRLPGEDSAGH